MKKTTISEVLMPQRILTVDSSTSSIAFAVFDRGSLVSYGKINLVGADVYLKAGNCCGKFYALIKKIKPDAVVVESPIYSNSPKTAMHLALVQGALYGSSYMAGVRVFRAISPIQWQNYVGTRLLTSEEKSAIEKNFPNKSKSWYKTKQRQVRKNKTITSVNNKFGIKVSDDDIADAIALGWFVSDRWKSLFDIP